MDNPTLDPIDYSRTLIQETIRPNLEAFLEETDEFDDPNAEKRGGSISGEPGSWPPLVVTELPGGGRVLYPHVVISEQGDDATQIDRRLRFSQHDFSIGIEIHGETATQMFNLRGLIRGWLLANREELREAGLAEVDVSGSPASWDETAKTSSWELEISGVVHTHPDEWTGWGEGGWGEGTWGGA